MSLSAIHGYYCAARRGGGPCDCGIIMAESQKAPRDHMHISWYEIMAKERDGLKAQLDAMTARCGRMEGAINRALNDSESGNGWGPDVTVCAYLREALAGGDQ